MKILRENSINSDDPYIIGDELYNYCLEHPAKAKAFSLLLSFSIADFDKANNINCKTSDTLLQINELLGEDLCIWYCKNNDGLENLVSMLNSFVESYEDSKKTKKELHQLIKSLESNNFEAKIAPLVTAFGVKDGTTVLPKLFERTKLNYVRDLLRLLTVSIEKCENLELVKFIHWLSENKMAILRNELCNLSKTNRDEQIIRKRAMGSTLEETSTVYALTHEGVRQIEKKLQKRFDHYIIRSKPHYILYAFSKNTNYISTDDIINLLGDLSEIFIYCLKKSNCSTACWSEELNGFIIGDRKWYEQLKEFKEGLPEILVYDSVHELITNVINILALPVVFDDAQRLVLADYRLTGKVYLKKKISLSRMYYTVLEKYYPNGIKLYDDSETIRFRNYLRELFGDIRLPENNRAIDVRLTELTILCGKGKHVLPSGVKIPLELLRKIHDAIIESDEDEIRFIVIFERFKNELLENSNISNKYFLQGVLRQHYSHEFDFTRYTLKKRIKSKTSSNQIKTEMRQELPSCLKT